jgi:hypothetical protein
MKVWGTRLVPACSLTGLANHEKFAVLFAGSPLILQSNSAVEKEMGQSNVYQRLMS